MWLQLQPSKETHQLGKMADLILPPEEHRGDDGKVTSAVHTIMGCMNISPY